MQKIIRAPNITTYWNTDKRVFYLSATQVTQTDNFEPDVQAVHIAMTPDQLKQFAQDLLAEANILRLVE